MDKTKLLQSKIIVCYLFTKFDTESTLKDFITYYQNYDSGFDHELLICFKLLKSEEIKNLKILLRGIKYTEFVDDSNSNDYDLGSYKRIAEKYQEFDILFLNSHSYPICDKWLKKLVIHKKDNNIIGTSASLESLLDSIKLKKFYHFFSYYLKKMKFKKYFHNFPNPHLRTSGFIIKGKNFYEFIKNKTINNKFDAWKIESGKNSLTYHFKKKGYNLFVVNSDGKKFFEAEWHLSETYNFMSQSKSIFSDKHSRKYLKLETNEKIKSQHITWGI